MPKFKLYRVERRGEAERFAQHEKLENRRLLFHGSQLENYLGILKQGLRVCPTEAPTTGYALGKGIYFADTFNKAKSYS
jgi:poly [ADP-ribose] polymerase